MRVVRLNGALTEARSARMGWSPLKVRTGTDQVCSSSLEPAQVPISLILQKNVIPSLAVPIERPDSPQTCSESSKTDPTQP